MSTSLLILILLGFSTIAYQLGRSKAFSLTRIPGKKQSLHSRPVYYGVLTAFWCGLPALLVFAAWQICEPFIITKFLVAHLPPEIQALPANRLNLVLNDIKNLVSGNIVSGEVKPEIEEAANHFKNLQATANGALAVIVLSLAIIGTFFARQKITPSLRARNHVEKVLTFFLIACSTFAIFTTIGIVLSVLFEAIRFFRVIPITEFLLGLEWSPQMAIRADQVGSSGAFGAIPVFAGTAMISGIAMLVAVPLGLMSAIFLSEYANKRFRSVAKPLLEILAGIPTVVYGFFAALTVAPFIRDLGVTFGLDVSSEREETNGIIMIT